MIGPRPDWHSRLPILRLLFAAVLIAPRTQVGLGLSGGEAVKLTPARLSAQREALGIDETPAACPRCLTWHWLKLIGINYMSSRFGVREALSSPVVDDH